MSNFWDSILKSSETVADTAVVNGSDFWASIGLGVEAKTKPVKQIKVKAVKKTAKKKLRFALKLELKKLVEVGA